MHLYWSGVYPERELLATVVSAENRTRPGH